MAEISAATVMKLRKMSGQGMMDCKKALQQANGDIDEAMGVLRKKGLATLSKRAERETSEGVVIAAKGSKWASLATLCCETDFVARSDDFTAVADLLGDYAAECKADNGADNLRETEIDGKKLSEVIAEAVSKTGEKVQIGDYEKYVLDEPGLIGTYIHFNGKVGAMVHIGTSDENAAAAGRLGQAAADIAMHITAIKPLTLDRNSVDAETVEREKSIFAAQIKNKPPQIIEKIIEGKIKKFYSENCLLEQPFVKDDSKTVADVLSEAAESAGGEANIKRFVRFEVG